MLLLHTGPWIDLEASNYSPKTQVKLLIVVINHELKLLLLSCNCWMFDSLSLMPIWWRERWWCWMVMNGGGERKRREIMWEGAGYGRWRNEKKDEATIRAWILKFLLGRSKDKREKWKEEGSHLGHMPSECKISGGSGWERHWTAGLGGPKKCNKRIGPNVREEEEEGHTRAGGEESWAKGNKRTGKPTKEGRGKGTKRRGRTAEWA